MHASTDPVAQQIIALIAQSKQIPAESITPESTFDQLGVDSLDRINLSFEVEELFGISIPDDALVSLRSVADVVVGVHRLQAQIAGEPNSAAGSEPSR